MNILKSIALFCMLLGLSACDTLGVKDSDADMAAGDGTSVVVEDRTTSATGIDGQTANGDDLNGTETQVIVGEDGYAGNEINDPANPLSNKVVYFEYDSTNVRVEDQATLAAHGAYLSKNPNLTMRLVGHTDERGAREYNLALGERRALSIRQILMLQGANLKQFEVTSFGEERPQVEGHDESAWQQNRRVELVYIGR